MLKLRRSKYINQYNIAVIISAALGIFLCNYLFDKATSKLHISHQESLSQTILSGLSIELEYGLSFGNKEDLITTLQPLSENKDVALIKVYDNQKNIFAQLDNRDSLNIPNSQNLLEFKKDITQNLSANRNDELFLNEEVINAISAERKLGSVYIGMSPIEYSSVSQVLMYYKVLLNLALAIAFVLLWSFILYKQYTIKITIEKLIKALRTSHVPEELKEKIQTSEGLTLSSSIIDKIQYAKHLEYQLNLLKTEVTQARLDGNTELQEFIGFIKQNPSKVDDSDLNLFYQSIIQEVGKHKSAIWCKDILKKSITKLSPLSHEYHCNIFDHYTGDKLNQKAILDEKSFTQFLQLIIEQLIYVCKDNQISISLDQRTTYQDNTLLRISIESEADSFAKALSLQSFFHFREHHPITPYSNNLTLISAKHLLRKLGGEYFFFHNEIRFEIPITTIAEVQEHSQEPQVEIINKDINALVFDSDPIDKMVLMGYLEKLSVSSDKATTKQVVLQKLRRDKFDVIIVNSEFFNEPDPFFFSSLRNELANAEHNIKILVVSSDQSVQENILFEQLDASFITKPINLQSLRDTLHSL